MADPLVIETTILIDYRRGVPEALSLVDDLTTGDAAAIHPISAAELLQGVLNQVHLRDTVGFIHSFKRLRAKSSDFERCLALMAAHRLSHGIEWPDCLIAATCIRLGLPLVTLNDKHFRAIRGLRVVRPY